MPRDLVTLRVVRLWPECLTWGIASPMGLIGVRRGFDEGARFFALLRHMEQGGLRGRALAPPVLLETRMPARTLKLVMVLTAITVIAGVGLCLFDTNDAGQGDLCFSFFAASGSLASMISVLPAGRVAPAFTPVACSPSSDLPTPPPKA